MKRMALLFLTALITLALTACPGSPAPVVKDFSITASAITITLGDSDTSNITITRNNAFAGAVNLTVQGLPTGVTHTFTPNPVSGNTSILKLSVAASAPTGSNNITVKGTSGAKTATTVFNLTIKDKVDTTAPTIVNIGPVNNAKGINENAKIIVRFSEAMNQQSAQAAFQSPDIGGVSFAWSDAGKLMTVTPNNKLKYSATKDYKYYHYSITTTAKDLAGNPLNAAKNIKFSTYRTHYWYYLAEPLLDGYVYNTKEIYNKLSTVTAGDVKSNNFARGFLSFDMSARPADIIAIRAASVEAQQWKVAGKPYADLGKLNIYHLYYGLSLEYDDFSRAAFPGGPKMFSNSPSLGVKKAEVTQWVQGDYDNRTSRKNRSQFRLQFSKNTDGKNDHDYVELHSSDQSNRKLMPVLRVWYWVK